MTTYKNPHARRQVAVLIALMVACGLLLLLQKPVKADTDLLLRATTHQAFDATIADVQSGLTEQGFEVLFVQGIDIGLAKAGYHSDKYRIIFLMPEHGVAKVLATRTDLADAFPFKVTVYQDKGRVVVFRARTASQLDASVPAEVRRQFQAWDNRLDAVVKDIF